MNNLVATLLLTHPAEEDAFWVLVCIIEVRSLGPRPLRRPRRELTPRPLARPQNILPSDYYTSHLLVSRADQQVLQDLVVRTLPKLAAHLEDQCVELTAISFGWFLSLFTDSLPIQVRSLPLLIFLCARTDDVPALQTLLCVERSVLFSPSLSLSSSPDGPSSPARSRVWDLFFIHGTIFLFRVALAILKLHEADLLECDSAASLYALLGQLPAGLWNADRLLKVRPRLLSTLSERLDASSHGPDPAASPFVPAAGRVRGPRLGRQGSRGLQPAQQARRRTAGGDGPRSERRGAPVEREEAHAASRR